MGNATHSKTLDQFKPVPAKREQNAGQKRIPISRYAYASVHTFVRDVAFKIVPLEQQPCNWICKYRGWFPTKQYNDQFPTFVSSLAARQPF